MKKNLKDTSKLFLDTRHLLDKTQEKFAKELKMSQTNLCQIENGNVNPPGDVTLIVLKKKLKAESKIGR